MESFVTLSRCFSAVEAHMLKNKLEAEGVFCQLINETGSQVYNFYTQSNGGIQLKVHQRDLNLARSILESNIREDLLTQKYWDIGVDYSEVRTQPRIRLFIGLVLLMIILVIIVFIYGK